MGHSWLAAASNLCWFTILLITFEDVLALWRQKKRAKQLFHVPSFFYDLVIILRRYPLCELVICVDFIFPIHLFDIFYYKLFHGGVYFLHMHISYSFLIVDMLVCVDLVFSFSYHPNSLFNRFVCACLCLSVCLYLCVCIRICTSPGSASSYRAFSKAEGSDINKVEAEGSC